MNRCTVTGIEDLPNDSERALRVFLRNEAASSTADGISRLDYVDVDLLVIATGYRRDGHRDLLKEVQHLVEPGCVDDPVGYVVDRNYDIRFSEGAVSPDAGIWLQCCNESTRGLSDTLLSILATRGGEMVTSIFGRK